jgi:2-polyprenyl-3-methyl-5-hydroxy-6-metoxy-1,4-benzoquinol methylase
MDIEEYAKYTQLYSEEVPELLLKYLQETDWQSFLDAGCGDGSLLFALNKKGYFQGKTVYGVDLSRKRIELCRQINPAFKCSVDSAEAMREIKDGSINFLVSTQVIEHVPSDEAMVCEIARVVNSQNNTVYLSTVFKKWYGWYFYRCNGRWTLDPTHLREYTADDQLFGLLRRAGLEILASRKKLYWFPVADFFLRKLGWRTEAANNPVVRFLSWFKVPIWGYYNWEIVGRKKKL